jgi:hypothetical protein
VSQLQENLMKICIDKAFQSNVPKNKRPIIVSKIAEWKMLDKHYRTFVYLAIEEVEAPAVDEEDNAPSRRKNSSARRTRRRGGRGTSSSDPLDWIPSPQEAILPESGSDPYRLATLMVHKILKSDDWDEDWNDTEASLRDSCLKNGVHPVWVSIGEKSGVLGIFAGFPKAKVEEQASAEIDISLGRINVDNTTELTQVLDKLTNSSNDAGIHVAYQKVASQLKNNRTLKVDTELLELSGPSSIISVLLHLANGSDASDSLKELTKHDSQLASELSDFLALKSGVINDWQQSRSVTGEDSLSQARRLLAWQNTPTDVGDLTSEELNDGLDILREGNVEQSQIEKLLWWRLSALHSEGKGQEAVEVLISLQLDSSADLSSLLPLVADLPGDSAIKWLNDQIPNLDEMALTQISISQKIDVNSRSMAIKRLQDSGGDSWEQIISAAIPLFTMTMELKRLSKIIVSDDLIAISHPYETLLVAHNLAAGKDNDLWVKVRDSRLIALKHIHSEEAPETFSSTSEALLMLLEGSNIDDNRLTSLLDKDGLKAFGEIRQALSDGGDGIASAKSLDDLSSCVETVTLSPMERDLFNTVISTLRLNRVGLMLQNGNQDEEARTTLDTILAADNISTGLIHTVRHLVLEHDIGLPTLVSWYQVNHPLSPWHTLARAAVSASNGDELNSARDYRKAGDHEEFDYEHSIMLYRKALIHLAFASQWKEAVELLEAQPALKTALTRRFQLYLKVSFTASQQNTDQATKILKEFVRKTKMVSEENADGEMEQHQRTYFADEELDMLRSYHLEHPRPLPREPFAGRVTAAFNSLNKNRRRQKSSFDTRFIQLMQGNPTLAEVYELSTRASEEKAIDGLMFLERAQTSGKYTPIELSRLADSERTLFTQYKNQIPTSKRRYLRHLKLTPLIIVDTNILMDSLVQRLATTLQLNADASLDITGVGNFHNVLLNRAKDGKVKLWLPKVVKSELKALAKGIDRLKSRFSDSLVSPEILESTLTEEVIGKLVDDVLSDFNTWKPLDLHMEADSDNPENTEAIEKFLLDHYDIFEELTAMKRTRGSPRRTELEGNDVYPEEPDLGIIKIAMHLADQALSGIGTVLVATRDGDFTLVARAFEERFGFGVAKNSRTLNLWIRS